MNLAHLTHEEFPTLLAVALVAAGVGVTLGIQLAVRALLRRRR